MGDEDGQDDSARRSVTVFKKTMVHPEDFEGSVGGFKTVRVNDGNAVLTYRAAICNKEEADQWLDHYSRMTRTHWIVKQSFPNVVR